MDNSWGPKTLPGGSREGGGPGCAWWSYGGIVREVGLLVSPQTYIANVKIESRPDLDKKSAALTVRAWIRNTSGLSADIALGGEVAGLSIKTAPQRIPAGATGEMEWTGVLQRPRLWDWRDPYLYIAAVEAGGDTFRTQLAIRKVEVRGAELRLNGRPVHLFGANRHSDHPRFGLIEPPEVIEQDLGLMVEANLRFMRIGHLRPQRDSSGRRIASQNSLSQKRRFLA
jgi:beta-galactosidase/beta-glucuronidase